MHSKNLHLSQKNLHSFLLCFFLFNGKCLTTPMAADPSRRGGCATPALEKKAQKYKRKSAKNHKKAEKYSKHAKNAKNGTRLKISYEKLRKISFSRSFKKMTKIDKNDKKCAKKNGDSQRFTKLRKMGIPTSILPCKKRTTVQSCQSKCKKIGKLQLFTNFAKF